MKIVFLDIEANGYQDVNRRETVQIGAVKCDYDTGETEYFNELVLPEKFKKITQHCFQITGINDKQVQRNGKPFEEVIELFDAFSDGCMVLSWDEFDFVQIKKDCLRKGDMSFIDKFELRYYNFQKIYQLKNNIMKKPSLTKTLNDMELRYNEYDIHTALADANNLKKLFESTGSLATLEKISKFNKEIDVLEKENNHFIISKGGKEIIDSEVYYSVKKHEKKKAIPVEIKNNIEKSVITINSEKCAEILINLLNLNNVWDEVYIKTY